MKIYTKAGDSGGTSLYGGTRVKKGCLQVAAYGHIDEVNAQIGFLKTLIDMPEVKEKLHEIQLRLIILSTELGQQVKD